MKKISIYPRTCEDCERVYQSRATFYTHTKSGACAKTRQKIAINNDGDYNNNFTVNNSNLCHYRNRESESVNRVNQITNYSTSESDESEDESTESESDATEESGDESKSHATEKYSDESEDEYETISKLATVSAKAELSEINVNGKTIRTIGDKASVFDIIKVVGGQQNQQIVWQRIKHDEAIIAFCDYHRLGEGQKATPVISKEGVVLLINLIPGKQALIIKLKWAAKIVRLMAGEEPITMVENATICENNEANNVSIVKQSNTPNNFEFNGKTIRTTSDNQASVYDLIKVIGGQQNPHLVWNRIKDRDTVLSFCKDCQFEGERQRSTPVISKEGVVLLINLIPGKQALSIKLEWAAKIVRLMAGDETLTEEIADNAQIAANSPTSAQAFFAKDLPKRKPKVKINTKQPFIEQHIYVRAFDELIRKIQNSSANNQSIKITEIEEMKEIEQNVEFEDSEERMKDKDKGKSKMIMMTIEILKFGIGQVLKNRCDGYGEDNGSFRYSICVPDRETAIMIESILRAKFKKFSVGASFEYLYVEKLKELPNWKLPGYQMDYETALRIFHTIIVGETHRNFPQLRDNFGISYTTIVIPNIKGKITNNTSDATSDCTTLSTISKPLTVDDLPEYSTLFPELMNGNINTNETHKNTYSSIQDQVKCEQERTKQKQEERMAEEERTKQKRLEYDCLKLQIELAKIEMNL